MKIKAIANLCKETNWIQLIDIPYGDGYRQWIGNGCAIYPIIGMPYLHKENIFTLLEIPEEKQNDYHFSQEISSPNCNFDDTDETEKKIEEIGISLGIRGRILRPVHASEDIAYYDSKYMTPLRDIATGREIYERRTVGGGIYFAIKQGFVLYGIIMPYNPINKTFVECLEYMAASSRTLFRAAEEEAKMEQVAIDPQTGEID